MCPPCRSPRTSPPVTYRHALRRSRTFVYGLAQGSSIAASTPKICVLSGALEVISTAYKGRYAQQKRPADTITLRAVISIRRYMQGWCVVIGQRGHPLPWARHWERAGILGRSDCEWNEVWAEAHTRDGNDTEIAAMSARSFRKIREESERG
jgi:hypothetical protein